jgi:hypothetical protein
MAIPAWLLVLGALTALKAVAVDGPPAGITILPSDGFNLRVKEQVDEHYVIVELASPAHNWFAALCSNLPTDAPVTIGMSMAGNDTKGNKANVGKWDRLAPVMTYADPAKYESYECFERTDEGAWLSTDPLKPREKRYAGIEETPEQTAIPAELAKEFLSKDGRRWEPWREVDRAEAFADANVFRITHHFRRAAAAVAMRVPYTYTYLQQICDRVQAANLPGVTVEDLGVTRGGRKLQVIRVAPAGTADQGGPQQQVSALVVAREHATEPAGSWVVHGVLQRLLTAAPRELRTVTWLLVPMQDPDGCSESISGRLTDVFYHAAKGATPPEAVAYGRYFVAQANAGRTVDLCISLHGVEANEGPNLFSPFADSRIAPTVVEFNRGLFASVAKGGVTVGKPESQWGTGMMGTRMYAWCAMHFGGVDLAYEVNDRQPGHRLTLQQLTALGGELGSFAAGWLATPPGLDAHARARGTLEARQAARAAYLKARGPASRQELHELLDLGY